MIIIYQWIRNDSNSVLTYFFLIPIFTFVSTNSNETIHCDLLHIKLNVLLISLSDIWILRFWITGCNERINSSYILLNTYRIRTVGLVFDLSQFQVEFGKPGIHSDQVGVGYESDLVHQKLIRAHL